MGVIKKELVKMLNGALELEHAARIQYLAHAELVVGENAEPIIARLKEIASDEAKHEDIFRDLVANYLGGEPSMAIAPTHKVSGTKKILEVNLKGEKDAIGVYKNIYKLVVEKKQELEYEFEKIEHDLRHVIIDEEEHVIELSLLLGR